MNKDSNGNTVAFIDTSTECMDLLKKFAKDGLKASGKIITTIMKDYIQANHSHTGNLAKAVGAWAIIDRDTGQPSLQVGYRSRSQMRKRGVKFYVNPWWFEFGVRSHEITTNQYKNIGKSSYELHDNNGKKFGVIVTHPGLREKNFLRNTVYDNIKEIRDAQSDNLGKIQDMMIEKGMKVDIGEDEEID